MTVVALDGNPCRPAKRRGGVLAPAERADVVVEMNRPGVWIFGGIQDEDRRIGLGTVVEYANARGEPQWAGPCQSRGLYDLRRPEAGARA